MFMLAILISRLQTGKIARRIQLQKSSENQYKNTEVAHYSKSSDIENQYKAWMGTVKRKLNQVPETPSNCSIYRVPERLRNVNKDAYIPQLVSIGPLHHGKDKLPAMEEHKWRYMRDFFIRTPDPESSLEECGKAILGLKQQATDCYADAIGFDSDKFLEIMLVDGCFIVELFLKYSIKESRDQNDPLFNTAWMITTLERDLVLLENQIPFFILETLFSKLTLDPPSITLVGLAFSFFNLLLRMDKEWLQKKSTLHGKHLLDLLRNSYLPSSPQAGSKSRKTPDFIHCATELRRAGIDFKKVEAENLFDIKFSNGVLEIPEIRIRDGTDSLFRNMIAFEQCCHGSTHLITSYAVFMDCLINSAEDVALLQRKRIIANYLGGEEDVAVVFNTLCKEVVLNNFYFRDLCDQVDTYYKKRWHIYKAKLRRDYFSNPWAIISLTAALVLLGLTILQSTFAVLAYYQ